MQYNRDEIRVSIWNFQSQKPKFRDYFLKNEEFLHLTLRQLESLIQQKYLKTQQKIILFHGKTLTIDDSNVSDIFNKHTINLSCRGQICHISPYRLSLQVMLEEQVMYLSQEDKTYFQNEMALIAEKRRQYQLQQMSAVIKYEQMIKEKQQICFVIDTTRSMEINKQKIQEIIKKVALEINNGIYSFVLYKDFKQKINNKYLGLGFVCSSREVCDYVENQNFQGGDDIPDDLQGVLEQSLQYNWNLLNQDKQKTIVVITDAPCHGMKYHSQQIHDDYPNEDIKDTILKIISKNISLQIYTFNDQTDIMIEEINNIQRKLNVPNAFQHFRINTSDENSNQNNDLDTTRESVNVEDFHINLQNCRILDQLSKTLTNQHINIMNKQPSSKINVTLVSYYSKFGYDAERSLTAYLNSQDIIMLKDAQEIQITATLKPILKEKKDQIYLIKFNDKLEYENKLYYTKTVSFRINEDQAIKILQNHYLAKILLQHFKQSQSIKPDHPNPDVTYSDLIVLKINNQFIICEEYTPIPFAEFNSTNQIEINIQNQNDDLNLFLQYFSYESCPPEVDFDLKVLNLIGFSDGKQTILTDPHLVTDKGLLQQVYIYIRKHESKLSDFRFPSYFSIYG